MHLPGFGSLMYEFRQVNSSLVETLDIRSKAVPSVSQLSRYNSLILVGDFADNSKSHSGKSLNSELIKLWTSIQIQKSWLCLNDLHIGIEKLLLGKNNNEINDFNSRRTLLNDLSSSTDKLFWRYEQNNYEDFSRDHLYESRLKHRLLNEIKCEFIEKFQKRIDLPILLRPSEFVNIGSIKSMTNRKYDYFIPGRRYDSRDEFRQKLSKSNYVTGPYSLVDRFIRRSTSKLHKLNFKFSKNLEFKLRYINQKYFIANSKFTYTDGNHVNYLVRKFIEIPASGGLLVAPRDSIITSYGFEPWNNFVPQQEWKRIFECDTKQVDEIVRRSYAHVEKHFNMQNSLPKILEIAIRSEFKSGTVEKIY